MAHYNYRIARKHNHPWIDCLRIVEPVTHAGTLWTEIHFTQPKQALVHANLRPHVTFVSGAGTSHWYLRNAGGNWVVEYGNGRGQEGEGDIARNVLEDAEANGWIRAAPPLRVTDEEGFATVESRGKRKGRMQTGWR